MASSSRSGRTGYPISSCFKTPCATRLSFCTARSTSCSRTAKTCARCRSSNARRGLKALLPRHKLIAFSNHRKGNGTKFFAEAELRHLEGIMAKRADSPYASGRRTADWLKVKTAQRQEVVIAGFTAPRRTRPFFGALVLAVREDDAWRYIGHVGTGFSHQVLEEL